MRHRAPETLAGGIDRANRTFNSVDWFSLQSGETPLHLACRGCRADVVRNLIGFVKARQGDEAAVRYVNAVNEDGASALHFAAQITKSEVEHPLEDKLVIKLLLEAGADVYLQASQVRG